MFDVLIKLVDAGMLAGWVRAGVAALFGALSGIFVGPFIGLADAEFQTAVGIVAGTIVAGVWSMIAKKVAPPAPPAA